MPIDLTRKWAVGFRDRGLGHGDYAVVEAPEEEPSTDPRCPDCEALGGRVEGCVECADLDALDQDLQRGLVPLTVVVEVPDQELAEHLVELHNQSLERSS